MGLLRGSTPAHRMVTSRLCDDSVDSHRDGKVLPTGPWWDSSQKRLAFVNFTQLCLPSSLIHPSWNTCGHLGFSDEDTEA